MSQESLEERQEIESALTARREKGSAIPDLGTATLTYRDLLRALGVARQREREARLALNAAQAVTRETEDLVRDAVDALLIAARGDVPEPTYS